MKPGPAPYINWDSNERICPTCPEVGPQPLDNFFSCVTRKNGKTSQCKVCISKRDRKAYRQLQRKGCVRAKRKPTRKERVLKAIEGGARFVLDIHQVTQLSESEIYDALARLWDENRLDRQSLRQRVYRVAA